MQATSQWSAQQWECECDRLAGLGANSHARKQKQGKSYFLQIQLVSSTRSLIDKLHTHICTNKPINLCQQNYFFSVAFVFFSIHLTLSSSSIFCISFFFCFAQLFSSHLFIFDCTYSYIFAIFFFITKDTLKWWCQVSATPFENFRWRRVAIYSIPL